MKIQKESVESPVLTLGDLTQGDLFEKGCAKPMATYLVIKPDTSSRRFVCEVIKPSEDEEYAIVVDLGRSIVKAMPFKTAVTLLETQGLTVREVS